MLPYSKQEVKNVLDEQFMTPYLMQAQLAEAAELRKAIQNLSRNLGKTLDILDIGVGYARTPVELSRVKEIWDLVASYDGIDNSQEILLAAKSKIGGLEGKVNLHFLDARSLSQFSGREYDLAVCTYFTSGNFPPSNFSFETSDDGKLKNKYALDANDTFQKVFRAAYELLRQKGQIILGSIYTDNEDTRKKQEEFYRECGMTIITGPEDSFTATKEGFWSQRFSEGRIRNYFPWISPSNIEFIPLDAHDFAKMVIVTKK